MRPGHVSVSDTEGKDMGSLAGREAEREGKGKKRVEGKGRGVKREGDPHQTQNNMNFSSIQNSNPEGVWETGYREVSAGASNTDAVKA